MCKEPMKGSRIAELENECDVMAMAMAMAMNKGKKEHGKALYTNRIGYWEDSHRFNINGILSRGRVLLFRKRCDREEFAAV